ncbi:hypothetical protein T492DRAFT_613137 [Pavlovales sp. CCMP2436]|nr:hypothetical protein T492DRAFT_613137 [Pavlovales sp. CCMP2436]
MLAPIAIDRPGTANCIAAGALVCYATLLAFAFATGEKQALMPSERLAAGIAALILFTALLIRGLEKLVRPSAITGVGTMMLTVHWIACCTNLLMALAPMPILIDPFTHCRVHLVRWCEWTTLAFVMSFTVEAIDSYDFARPIAFGLTQGGSTICGYILPFTVGPVSWGIVMTISFILYADLLRRVYIKFSYTLEQPAGWPKGGSPQKRDAYRRWISARRLIASCAVMWTAFVLDYFGAWLADVLDPCQRGDASCRHVPAAWPFVLDCIVDVAAKMSYAIVLSEIYESVPVLYELELSEWFVAQMSIVWENSSDVLVISTRSDPNGLVSTTASGSLHELIGISAVGFTSTTTHNYTECTEESLTTPHEYFFLHMVNTAWNESMKIKPDASGGPTVFLREYRMERTGLRTLGCEAHASALPDGSALVMVIRDISDRISRHNAEKALLRETAEKRLISETVSRQKDEEANRFTRHEVKNGMLSAMSALTSLEELHKHGISSGAIVLGEYDRAFSSRLGELHGMLQHTLSTVLAQAMARDVLHGAYTPRPEPINLRNVLVRCAGHAERFEMRTLVEPFPVLELDPKLVFHIHRNAISNACKYGEHGGEVRTELDHVQGQLTLRVFNRPGEGHAKLLALDDTGCIFKKGVRLHPTDSVSSGDGAWIMTKCAEAMDGTCSIAFSEQGTVFEFKCTAHEHVGDEQIISFVMPRHVRAIGIDDAPVQRIIMRSMFNILGVPPENVTLWGSTSEEIDGFDALLAEEVRQHPECIFIVLSDENLDVDDGLRTVSGSEHLERVRGMLTADQEARTLLLVRSANDSDADLELYSSRAHGSLAKDPLQREGLLRAIVPQWLRRFGSFAREVRATDNVVFSAEQLHDALATEVCELLARIEGEDAWVDWSRTWRLLHAIKGNMQSLGRGKSQRVVMTIERMRCLVEAPVDWADVWQGLRADVFTALAVPSIDEQLASPGRISGSGTATSHGSR